MGVVYKARHARLDRMVAIKVLPPGAGADPAFAERFTREARALARLNHPNILAIYDFGQAGEEPFFVMEYVEGTDLRQRLRAGPLPPPEALQVAARICDALQYAHEEGVVHRDVKPENVLIDKRGRVKIADFGIAKLLTGRTAQYTLTGPWQVVGTVRYMAPEQMDNPLTLDHRADIYSLGVVLYEMLTGELPLGRFPPPSHKAGVDIQFDEVVLRALEREAGRRYQQASEMKAALEALVSQVARSEPAPAAPAPEKAASRTLETDSGNVRDDIRVLIQDKGAAAGQETQPVTLNGPADLDRQAILRRVKKPAIRLLIAGTIGFLVSGFLVLVGAKALLSYGASGLERFFFGVECIGPLVSVLLISGALGMLRFRFYSLAYVASLAAVIPLSIVWPISVWVGFWSLRILHEPAVHAAFGY
jgi:serine/threonine protein kinase